MDHKHLYAICAVICFIANPVVHADVISVNVTLGVDPVTGATDPSSLLAPTDVVGVVSVSNWNNIIGQFDGDDRYRGNVDINNLVDDSGAATTLDLSTNNTPFRYYNSTPSLTGDVADDAVMMRTALGESNQRIHRYFFSDNPFEIYDVYVYFGGKSPDAANGKFTIAVNYLDDDGASPTQIGSTLYLADNDRVWDGTYNESTATTAADAVDGNEYVVFRNMTATDFTIELPGTPARGGISGIQIVEVIPEPSSLVLLSLAGILSMSRRRT